jgi:7TMR-DISM extracellular 2
MAKNLSALFMVVILIMVILFNYHQKSTANIKPLHLQIYHFEDISNSLKINQIIKIKNFELLENQTFTNDYMHSVKWFKFQVEASNKPLNLSFDINNNSINVLSFYEVIDGKPAVISRTGDWLKFDSRPSATKSFVFPLTLAAHQIVDYYLMVDKHNEIWSLPFGIPQTMKMQNNAIISFGAYFLALQFW